MEQHSLQVGTLNYRDSICQRLQELREKEDLPVSIHESKQGKRWLINCEFRLPTQEVVGDQSTMQKIHSYYLANALAETILHNWEKDYVRYVLRRKYRMKKEELEAVLTKAIDYLNKNYNDWHSYRINRKTSLVNQILNCLENQPLFDIEGFLRFRVQDYKKEVEQAVAHVVDEHILEKEYTEFIELLKHFVDMQTPRLDTLHVGITTQGKFHLYNEQGKKVTNQFLDEFSLGEGINEFSYEDMLISALIAVAPRQIVMHIRYEGYLDTLQTIRRVFDGRVSYCVGGCHICEKI